MKKNHRTKTELIRDLNVLRKQIKRLEIDFEKKSSRELTILDHAMKSISEAITITDEHNTIVFVNDTFLRMYGYEREELIGLSINILRIKETLPPVDEILTATLMKGWQGELINRRKDGSTFPIWLSTSVVRDENGNPLGLVGVTTDITERKQAEKAQKEAEAALRESRDQLRKLTARLETVREKERKYIAHEMREEFGQILSAIKLHMSNFSRRYSYDKVFVAELTELFGFIDGAIQSVQKISTDLRPGVLDLLGLSAAIEWQAKEFSKQYKIACSVDVPKEKVRLQEQSPIILFRILQDALRNVAEHAQASNVIIRLHVDAQYLELQIEDNGRGMSEEKLKSPSSIGFVLMKERALSIGGSAEIKAIEGKGTIVLIRIPLSR
ncbi:MAG: PAS domain S-box protein [Bacteroidota bacterium]